MFSLITPYYINRLPWHSISAQQSREGPDMSSITSAPTRLVNKSDSEAETLYSWAHHGRHLVALPSEVSVQFLSDESSETLRYPLELRRWYHFRVVDVDHPITQNSSVELQVQDSEASEYQMVLRTSASEGPYHLCLVDTRSSSDQEPELLRVKDYALESGKGLSLKLGACHSADVGIIGDIEISEYHTEDGDGVLQKVGG